MIQYLQDVDGLEALEGIARRYGVVITARGELVRRLYAHTLLRPDAPDPDLFELTPFTTAIELSHSGGPRQNIPILRAIHRSVPLAECYRWELRSSAEDEGSGRARASSALFPANDVTLSTSSGFDDPSNASKDILEQRYRFERNPAYADSPLYQVGRDLEAFGAIRYLRTLFDAGIDDLLRDQPGLHAVQSIFRETRTPDTARRLRRSAFLRMRLHQLLQELGASTCSPTARSLIDKSGLREFVAFADGDSPLTTLAESAALLTVSLAHLRERQIDTGSIPRATFSSDLGLDEYYAITISQHLHGDSFRLPARVPFVQPRYADAAITDAFGRMPQSTSVLAEGVELIRVSSWIPILPGRTSSSRTVRDLTNEMFYFALLERGDASRAPADEDVSMLMLLHAGRHPTSIQIAAPLVMCSIRPCVMRDGAAGRVQSFRVACGSMLEELAGAPDTDPLHVAFMIAARRVGDETSEPAILERFKVRDGVGGVTTSVITA